MHNTARIELHLHLDGSLNIRWAYEKSLQRNVIPPETTFVDYYNLLFLNNAKPHAQSITKFDLTCSILQLYEDLEDAAYDLVRRLDEIGVWYAEIRFASQQHMKQGLTQKEALQAVIDGAARGMRDFPGIRIGIINCMMHKGENASANWDENLETIRVTKELLGNGAVGIDLAGFENNGDFSDYGPLIRTAKGRTIMLQHDVSTPRPYSRLDLLSGTKGVIRGYTTIINEELTKSDEVEALIELRVTPKHDTGFDDVAKTIMMYDEVESVSLMSGKYDLALTVKGRSLKEVAMFVSQRLSAMEGVLETATSFVLKRYKDKNILIEEEEQDERSMWG